MGKSRLQYLTKVLSLIFILATIVLIYMMYQDIDSDLSYRFVIGYLILCFILLIYMPVITIWNLRFLKKTEVKSKLLKFIALLAIFTAFNYGLDLIFRPHKLDLLRSFGNSIGFAFSYIFFDVIFLNKNKRS